MRRLFPLFFMVILWAGCSNQKETAQVRYHDNGFCKPSVALFHVYNHSSSTLPWDLSEEFTAEITSRLKNKDQLYLIKEEEIAWQLPMQTDKITPFHNETWLLENHPNTEFLAFIELVDHEMIPRPAPEGKNISFDLKINFRLKIVDVRDDSPALVLQEMVSDTFFIPWQVAGIDYNKTSWGKALFGLTPIGLAHSRLTKELSKRIEDYVLVANSRIPK